ncbi:hypothetical protein [Actinomadura sp. WMMA1423]|uniref:hypothetical protein n=1 Tax=Actinomadura sp. WMMA1423 TaxID=2591108 RepID=UPI0011475DAC|nr:hypothetical protein [Actinomadura sp. WMMA1423]
MNTQEHTLNGPEHFDAGERILKEAASETAPEWMLARSQLAAAHFAAAQASAALNENFAQALLSWSAEAPEGDEPAEDEDRCEDCNATDGQLGEANLGCVDRPACGLPPLPDARDSSPLDPTVLGVAPAGEATS